MRVIAAKWKPGVDRAPAIREFVGCGAEYAAILHELLPFATEGTLLALAHKVAETQTDTYAIRTWGTRCLQIRRGEWDIAISNHRLAVGIPDRDVESTLRAIRHRMSVTDAFLSYRIR